MKLPLLMLVLVVAAIACLMEALKAVIENMGNRLKKRVIDVPPFVWWIMGLAFSVTGTLVGLHILQGAVVDPSPFILVVTDTWAAFLWTPIVWWLQMQLDMKLVKGWLVPLVKKLVERKIDRL